MENAQDLRCLHCDSDRVVVGKINKWNQPAFFSADQLKKTWVTMEHPHIVIEKNSLAVLCLNCNLVWTSVNEEEATRKLRKYGTDELKSRVGLD